MLNRISSVLPIVCGISLLFATGYDAHAADGGKNNKVPEPKVLPANQPIPQAGGGIKKANGQNYKPFELDGEVVDTWCWSSGVMGEGRGDKHHSCGLACVLGGVTAGIVDDNNNLYICAKHQGYEGCNKMLAPYVAKRVHVKGWLTERGGCRLLKVGKVTEIKAADSSAKSKK